MSAAPTIRSLPPRRPTARAVAPCPARFLALRLALLAGILVVVLAPPPALGRLTGQAGPAHGVWPLRPRPPVVAGFDPPATTWGSGHRGVDLAGHVGEAVRTALAGRVTFAGSLAGRGVVVVDHGGTRTTYEPVGASVAVGDRVAAGDVVGRLQLFGSHCFPRACLHWGLIEGRAHYLDPLSLVGAAPVRLFPPGGGTGGSPALPGPATHRPSVSTGLPPAARRASTTPSAPLLALPAPVAATRSADPGWSPLRPQARGWAWW
jgi:hypothetical protein